MEREDGNLDREGEEKCERDPVERSGGKNAAGRLVLEIGEVEGVSLRIEPENRDKQRRGWDESEEEELERGARAVFAAIHGDEDGHGDERELPEAVVEHEVERDKDAEHGGLLDEEERVVNLAAGLDGAPTGDDADGREQADENDEPEAEAVDSDVVEDGGAFDPGNVALELEAGLAGDKVRGKMEREEESEERSDERDPIGKLGAVGQERDEDRACERNQQDEGKNGLGSNVLIFSMPRLSGLNHGDVTYFENGFGMKEGQAPRMGRASEQQKQEHGSGSGGQPRGVRAQIAGLPALENHSADAGDAGEKPGKACE